LNLPKEISSNCTVLFSAQTFSQSNTKFVVILDAGHGGDPGNSYHGFVEEIALKTTLKLEKISERKGY
jgi:N-acetylmuramoyl-L-alanine amidase